MSEQESIGPEKEINPSKKEIDETLEGVKNAQDPFFEKLEREMLDFLHSQPINNSHSEFEETRQKVLRKEEELRNDPQKQDVIRVWEERNSDYELKYIKGEDVYIENFSDKEVSLEFVDFLLGNFFNQNTDQELSIMPEEIQKVKVLRVSKDNNGIIISVVVRNGRALGLIFVGAPEFKLKIAEVNNRVFNF